MSGKSKSSIMPIISKIFCSPSEELLVIRRRPHVVNGGGFVVTNCSQKVVFKVDGCGVLGTKEELIVRDADDDAIILIRRKGGILEALSMHRKWKGYTFNYDDSRKLVFTLKEPNSSYCVRSNGIRISTGTSKTDRNWDFEVNGYFPDRNCSIVDSAGNVAAQIGVKKEVEELMANSKDLYHVIVKPGMDQAFIVGVTATLDYIYGESTRC